MRDWLMLLAHFLSLSLLAIGGVRSTLPEMHRYLVMDKHWLTDMQFSSSITLGQLAPGPNIMFVALFGWSVGINHAGYGAAFAAAMICMLGMVLPSTFFTHFVARWIYRNSERLAIRAIAAGLTPVVIAMILNAGWLLMADSGDWKKDWFSWVLSILAVVVVCCSEIHFLWLIAFGAFIGAAGLV